MKQPYLKIKPVGGIGQIGSNMTLVQGKTDTILIDAGILFPYEDFFDIDYLIPDLSKIPTPTHLIITHGHEDHIGAILHVVRQFPQIKVLATPFTATLIRKKLEYNGNPYPIQEYRQHDHLGFNDFTIDPIHVNHSIPETVGLLLKNHEETFGFFFVSDFKIDPATKFERPFDFEKLERLSKKLTKKMLLVDSTNIMSNQLKTPSEMDLIPVFDEIFQSTDKRIFITCFSSNIHRLMIFIELAKKLGRKIVPHGRSMISYLNSANEHGLIPDYANTVKLPEALTPNQENIIVLLSGCQGDFRGTFRRFCIGEDSTFKPRPDDLVLLSSKAIPGNEKKISLLTNKLSEIGVRVVTAADKLIHVSGHPGRDDLKLLYEKFNPTDIFPIHGETTFIRAHINHVKNVFPKALTHFVLNHDELHISENLSLFIVQGEKLEPIIIHGKQIVLEKEHISERRKLACNGSVFISLKLSKNLKDIEASSFTLQGLPNLVSQNEEKFKRFLENYLVQINFKDLEKSKEELRVASRKYFDQILGYKPQTFVHIL
jgi:ribonuclease J